MTAKSLGFEPKPEQKRMAGFGSLADVQDALETAVKDKEFNAGDRFSAADVYVGSQIGWGMQFGSIEKRPAFEAYAQRLQARPAAIRALGPAPPSRAAPSRWADFCGRAIVIFDEPASSAPAPVSSAAFVMCA